jgi:hypothetical protein
MHLLNEKWLAIPIGEGKKHLASNSAEEEKRI